MKTSATTIPEPGLDPKVDAVPDLNFRTALKRLDQAGRLMKVKSSVNSHLELTGILFQELGNRAVLFEQVQGSPIRVVGNCLIPEQNMLTIFEKDVPEMRRFLIEGLAAPMPPVTVSRGPVQEVFHDTPDVGKVLPLPFYAPQDGGRYISGGVVVARDPDTGVYNASYHRLMHAGENRMAIQLDLGRHLRALHEKMQARGKPLPIAVVLGPDMGVLYSAATMGALLPIEKDEYEVASGFLRRPVELVDCKTVPLQVPANAEIVLEGYISDKETLKEGPFMEFTGLYSDVGQAPVTVINCLYHRKDPILHVILSSEATIFRKHINEGAILKVLKAAAPCVTDVALTPGGLYRFHLVIQVRKRTAADEGFQRNAMYAAISALKDLDLLIAVDDDIDIHNWRDVEWALAMRWEASRGTIFMPNSRGHEYVTCSEMGVRTKVGIDATLPLGITKRHKRMPIPSADLSRHKISLEPGFE